jgi:putative ABC transport system ATP-binding protein
VLNEIVHIVREQGTSVVLVTHDAKVAAYGDREITMRDGVLDRSGLGLEIGS